jgi:hypothetical protein
LARTADTNDRVLVVNGPLSADGDMVLRFPPDVSQDFGPSGRVQVRGHFDDPAAATCIATANFPEVRRPSPDEAVGPMPDAVRRGIIDERAVVVTSAYASRHGPGPRFTGVRRRLGAGFNHR